MFAIMRTQKIKSMRDICGSFKHNLREQETPNADRKLSGLNYNLINIKNPIEAIKAKLATQKKIRKNAVLGIEVFLGASPEFFKNIDPKAFKDWVNGNIEYLESKYTKENIVSCVLHLDEQTPHLHAFIVPIDKKGKLNARYFIGGDRSVMAQAQTEYSQQMERFGLERGSAGSKATHKTVKEFYKHIAQKVPEIEFNFEEIENYLDNIEIPNRSIFESQENYTKVVKELIVNGIRENISETKKELKEQEKERLRILVDKTLKRLLELEKEQTSKKSSNQKSGSEKKINYKSGGIYSKV